jgi:N4-gp56 family major capsid protein
MSILAFNPTIWSKGFLFNLNKAHVHADVLNRDYEGEIKAAGDTVKISSIGRVTVQDYTRNSGLGGTDASPTITAIRRPEILQSSSLFLTVDQAKYFNFAIDDVDKFQQQPKLMDKAMKEAAFAMADTVDVHVNSTLQTGVAGTTDGTGNRLVAKSLGVGAGDDDAYETLVDLAVKLKEADVVGAYWVIVPPWFVGLLQKDVRFTNYGTGPNRETLLNGNIGRAASFDIKESNNLSGATSGTLAVAGGVYTILAGVKEAATYAEQIDSIDAFRPQDGFNDAVKGLHIYGSKVTRPFALASVACTQS